MPDFPFIRKGIMYFNIEFSKTLYGDDSLRVAMNDFQIPELNLVEY